MQVCILNIMNIMNKKHKDFMHTSRAENIPVNASSQQHSLQHFLNSSVTVNMALAERFPSFSARSKKR